MRPAVRRLLVRAGLAAAVVSLALAEDALRLKDGQVREGSRRIGRLVPAEEREALKLAAISVRTPEGDELLYGRIGGLWRCLDHHQALADERGLRQLVDVLLAAEGVVMTADRSREAGYGLADGTAWTVRLHGPAVLSAPDRDVQLAVEVGLPVPGLDGSYVRRVGENLVWTVDGDPRALLEGAGRPPLLDRNVLPAPWPPSGEFLQRVVVERAEGDSFVMNRRPLDLTPEEQASGVRPYRWVAQRPDGSELAAHPVLLNSFVNYLRLASHAAVLPASAAEQAGLERPLGRLLLETTGGETLTLLFGARRADGAVAVYNGWSRNLLLVEDDVVRLLLPRAAMVLQSQVVNPWQPALERAAPAPPLGFGR